MAGEYGHCGQVQPHSPFCLVGLFGHILMMIHSDVESTATLYGQSYKEITMIKHRIVVILDKILMILAVNDSIHRGSIVKSCKAICY